MTRSSTHTISLHLLGRESGVQAWIPVSDEVVCHNIFLHPFFLGGDHEIGMALAFSGTSRCLAACAYLYKKIIVKYFLCYAKVWLSACLYKQTIVKHFVKYTKVCAREFWCKKAIPKKPKETFQTWFSLGAQSSAGKPCVTRPPVLGNSGLQWNNFTYNWQILKQYCSFLNLWILVQKTNTTHENMWQPTSCLEFSSWCLS